MSGVDHLGFIVAAYAVTAVTLVATLVALTVDQRAQKRLLSRLGAAERDDP